MGSINGVVRDTNNVPMGDINMMITSGPSHPDIVAVTGDDGMFSFSDLLPGNYAIKAYGGGTESDDIPVEVFANKTVFVEIKMETNKTGDEENVVDEI